MTEPEERQRTWLPLIIAGSIALLVVVGVVVTHLVRADLSPQKRLVADACEAQYKHAHPSGPGLIGGDIYAAGEWRQLDETLVGLGYRQEQTLTGEEQDARDDAAAALATTGADAMTVVWQRDDESHALCEASLQGETVSDVVITELAAPAPTPSPSPSAP